MINEAYELAEALKSADIHPQLWAKELIDVPKTNPTIYILCDRGDIAQASLLPKDRLEHLRKYGDNHSSYPHMNLLPLYAYPKDEQLGDLIQVVKETPEKLTEQAVAQIESACTVNLWKAGESSDGEIKKLDLSMYHRCLKVKPHALLKIAGGFEPLAWLVNETDCFQDANVLHEKLHTYAFNCLNSKRDIDFALMLLFGSGKTKDNKLSFMFDAVHLQKEGYSTLTDAFQKGWNQALLEHYHAQSNVRSIISNKDADAFGDLYQMDVGEAKNPMPVFYVGKSTISLRTMNGDAVCQKRYGKADDGSFPLSTMNRLALNGALGWISQPERENATWIRISSGSGSDEWLFAFPKSFSHSQTNASYTMPFMFKPNSERRFEETARLFVKELREPLMPEADSNATGLQIFILRKIVNKNPGRTRIVYTRLTNADEFEECSKEWTAGCNNHPDLYRIRTYTPYPLQIASIINDAKQAKAGIGKKLSTKAVSSYHGIELLLEKNLPTEMDMHLLSQKSIRLATQIGTELAKGDEISGKVLRETGEVLSVLSMLLYREGIVMDAYSRELPYLLGQLLKESDELHALYCKIVRNGSYPSQLIGASLFRTAADSPSQAFGLLSQRIMPYYAWAKSYRYKQGESEEQNKEIRLVGWLLWRCEQTMDQLGKKWNQPKRFSDQEKAQLFIGYLASYKSAEKDESDNSKEE